MTVKGICADREKRLVRVTDGDLGWVITEKEYRFGAFSPPYDELNDCTIKEPADPAKPV